MEYWSLFKLWISDESWQVYKQVFVESFLNSHVLVKQEQELMFDLGLIKLIIKLNLSTLFISLFKRSSSRHWFP